MADGYDLERGRCKLGHTMDTGNGAAPDALNSIHQQLAGLFDQARHYLEAVGAESFFGCGSPLQ